MDLRVRYRIDGVLHEVDTVPKAVQSALISRLKIMSGVDITERRVPQNGRITMSLGGAQGRPAAGDAADRVGREDRAARARHRRHRPRPAPARLHRRTTTSRFSTSFTKPHGMVLVTGPDRVGQVHDAVRDAHRDQQTRGQHHHRRGPGRVPAARRQPGAGQPQGRADLRRGAAGDPALGPRHRAHRRDPRPRHRAARGRGRTHRSPRAVDAAHQRRAERRSPASSRWASSRSSSDRRWTACMAQRLARRLCRGAASPTCRRTPSCPRRAGRSSSWARRSMLWRPVGCRAVREHRLPRTHRAARGHAGVSEEIERLAVERASAHDIGRVGDRAGHGSAAQRRLPQGESRRDLARRGPPRRRLTSLPTRIWSFSGNSSVERIPQNRVRSR